LAFLSEDIGSVLKGGVKVCQRPLVNEVLGPFPVDFDFNLACKHATPTQCGFHSRLLDHI
jgi:hypothetical protein